MSDKEIRDIIYKECFTYKGKNADKIFNELYSVAYGRGHSYGYEEIRLEFEELDDLFSTVLNLTR